jgi:gas vesicle protein
MSTKSKVVLGILGAAAAGVIIGLLIAPEKGTEMRSRVKKTAGDWADQLTSLFNNGRAEYDELKERAKSMKADAAEKVSRVKENLG